MNNILNDGYYVPKDPELLKKIIDNSNFDYNKWAAERQSSIPTKEQFLKHIEINKILNEVCRTLKVSDDKLIDKIKNIKEEIEELNKELAVSGK